MKNHNSIFILFGLIICLRFLSVAQVKLCENPKIRLVENLDTSYFARAVPTAIISYNNGIIYSYNDGLHGTELWVSDGTMANTQLVIDINEGTGSSHPSDFVFLNNKFFFTAYNPKYGRELWMWDLNTKDDPALLADILPGSASSDPAHLVSNGKSFVFFEAYQPATGRELWKTNGNSAEIVKDIKPGLESSNINHLTLSNGYIYFTVDGCQPGEDLWKSDGTDRGTIIVKDFTCQSGKPHELFDFKGELFFAASSFKQPPSGSPVYEIELWKSDGTVSGTNMLKDINTTNSSTNHSSNPSSFVVYKDSLFFSVTNSTGAVFKSDGTSAGTVLASYTFGTPKNLTMSGDYLFFNTSGDFRLYRSDGSIMGTELIISTGYMYNLTSFNNELYFTYQNFADTLGRELWKSDGSITGTTLVHDIATGNNISALPQHLTPTDNLLFFFAHTPSSGFELYTNSTSDILNLLGEKSNLKYTKGGAGDLYQRGDLLWVSSSNAQCCREQYSLIIDGEIIAVDFDVVTEFIENANFINFNGDIFGSYLHSNRLYRFNASNALLEVFHEFDTKYSFEHFIRLKDQLLLYYYDDISDQYDMWSYNESGSVQLIRSFKGIPDYDMFHYFNDELYFLATGFDDNTSLWKTDGTSSGTQIADNFGLPNDIHDLDLFSSDSKLLMVGEDSQTGGYFTIITDGSTTGSMRLLDSEPSGRIVSIEDLFLYENQFQIWRTDGTPTGTYTILDRSSDTPDIRIRKLNEKFVIAINDSVYLTDGSLGNMQGYSIDIAEYWDGKSIWGELFIDNSDQNGVSIVSIMDESLSLVLDYTNLFVKEEYEHPLGAFYAVGDRIYFKADDGISGHELWTIDCHCAPDLNIDNICLDPGVYTSDATISLRGATQPYSSTELIFGNELTIDSTFEVKPYSELSIAISNDCK